MPRLCCGSAKQVNLFCSHLNRKVHFSLKKSALGESALCVTRYVLLFIKVNLNRYRLLAEVDIHTLKLTVGVVVAEFVGTVLLYKH